MEKTESVFKTLLMALIMISSLLWIRQRLAGWILPNGDRLEAIVEVIQNGEKSAAEAVFSDVETWLYD